MPRGTRGHPRVIQGFGYGVITHYDRTFQTVLLPIINLMSGPHNPYVTEVTQVWAVPLSLATTQGISVDFCSYGYLDVSVHRVRFLHLCIQYRILSKLSGFPHSDTSGSMPVSGSPKLFAAYHVLHRLSLPRHPPYALSSLTIKNRNQIKYYTYNFK